MCAHTLFIPSLSQNHSSAHHFCFVTFHQLTFGCAHLLIGTNRILIKTYAHRDQIKCKYNRIDGWTERTDLLFAWMAFYWCMHYMCATDFKMQFNEAKIVTIKVVNYTHIHTDTDTSGHTLAELLNQINCF